MRVNSSRSRRNLDEAELAKRNPGYAGYDWPFNRSLSWAKG